MQMHSIKEMIKGLVFEHFQEFRSGNLPVFEVRNKTISEVTSEISIIILEIVDCSTKEEIDAIMEELFFIDTLDTGIMVRAI